MTRRLKQRGRHIELPIIGDTLAEVRIAVDRLVTIIFRNEADSDTESTLKIAESINLSRGNSTQALDGSRPGISFAPQTLQPLFELVGCTVSDAVACEDGAIRIELSNAMHLMVAPTHGYEGWHFTSRSNLTSVAPVTLHGASGHLI